jgi:hypothetical protein
MMVYTASGKLKKRPHSEGDYLYYSNIYGNYAEIIHIDHTMQITQRKAFLNAYPKYQVAEDGLNPIAQEGDLGGLDAFVTAERIYVMPFFSSPKPKKEGYPRGYNDEVFIFDWKGNFIKSYQLDKPVHTYFVVDEKRNALIASTVDIHNGGEVRIERFEMD